MTTALVWISGASSGIGAALAATMPYDGTVVDISRSGGSPGTVHVAADLSTEEGWTAAADDFTGRLAAFDGDRAVFFSNAGTLEPVGFAGEVAADAYRRNVLLNSAAPQILGDAFLRAIRTSGFAGEAWLVTMTSGAARSPYPGWSSYGAGKAAVDQWTRTVGREQQQRGSRVTVAAVGPGVVATAMQQRIRRSDEEDFPNVERFRRLHSGGELADPDDVARRLWALLDTPPSHGGLSNGDVTDLRRRG